VNEFVHTTLRAGPDAWRGWRYCRGQTGWPSRYKLCAFAEFSRHLSQRNVLVRKSPIRPACRRPIMLISNPRNALTKTCSGPCRWNLARARGRFPAAGRSPASVL
jgi:hypothetical protein